MIRKETQKQNDISLIYWALPIRIKRKIANASGENVNFAEDVATPPIATTTTTAKMQNGKARANASMSVTRQHKQMQQQKEQKEQLKKKQLQQQQPGAKLSYEGALSTVHESSEQEDNDDEGEEEEEEEELSGRDVAQTPAVYADIGAFLRTEESKTLGEGMAMPSLSSSSDAVSVVSSESEISPVECAAIPGLLRLGAKQAELLQQPKVDRQEAGRKPRYPRSKAPPVELLMSPGRHLASSSNGVERPKWFESLGEFTADLNGWHSKYSALMARQQLIEDWEVFVHLHGNLQKVFVQVLLQHLKFCCEQKVDTYFWKLLFYSVKMKLEASRSPAAVEHLLWLLKDGLRFYAALYEQLSKKFPFSPELDDGDGSIRSPVHKLQSVAKVTAQKILICLGDLSRYKTKYDQTPDYVEAATFYQRAQKLMPTNGIPYNQLAIVAIQARKTFDAIYFHMRSLTASNTIYSAKESLLVLFDDIRRKYEAVESTASPVVTSARHNSNSGRQLRKEVWICPNGVRLLHCDSELTSGEKALAAEESRLRMLDAADIHRCFTTAYLHLVGKFYSGIGMESVQVQQRKMLTQFGVALKHTPLLFKRSRMLKMAALNVFVVFHNTQKERRREIRYYAFNFSYQFFGVVLRQCNELLAKHLQQPTERGESFYDLNTCLQFITIYSEWLGQNVDLWEPIRSKEHCFLDVGAELHSLFELIQRVQLSTEYDAAELLLEEDIFLAGFTLLPSAPLRTEAAPRTADETLPFEVRIQRIVCFQSCYKAFQEQLKLADDSYFVVENQSGKVSSEDDEEEEEEETEGDPETLGDGIKKKTRMSTAMKLALYSASHSSATDEKIEQLSKLKKELEARTKASKMHSVKLEDILSRVDTKLYIEVRPKYLLPDTNCFIDDLENFEYLLREFKHYILIIPLTVVKELDGLSKGIRPELSDVVQTLPRRQIKHFEEVSVNAKKTLQFIRTAKNNIKFATSKGSIINASLFDLVQEEYATNDDKIVATACALSKTLSTATSKDGKCLIRTELVLITTDRNLRVKALSRNLAVSELTEFIKWAKNSEAQVN